MRALITETYVKFCSWCEPSMVRATRYHTAAATLSQSLQHCHCNTLIGWCPHAAADRVAIVQDSRDTHSRATMDKLKAIYASVLLLTVVARTCEAFGTAGFEEFCFDDSKGIIATGLGTYACAEVVAQGYCRTEAYSKTAIAPARSHRWCVCAPAL